MSDAQNAYLADRLARLNTRATAAGGSDGERLFLLKRGEQSGSLVSIVELTEGWRRYYGEIRDDLFIHYSVTSDISDTWAQCSYFGFGIPDNDNEIFVYEIQSNQKEATKPNTFNNEWKAFAVRMKTERYAISSATFYYLFNGDRYTFNGDPYTFNP